MRPNDTVTSLRQDQNLSPNSSACVPFLPDGHDTWGSFVVGGRRKGPVRKPPGPIERAALGWCRVAKRSEVQLGARKDKGYSEKYRVRQLWL